MNLAGGIRYSSHARQRMDLRRVTGANIEFVLREHHTSYPAERLPNDPIGAMIYVATVDGRDLKVYVELGSEPPLVRSIAWRGQP